MTLHSLRFQRIQQSDIATTTCACGLNTGSVPAREADGIAEAHADAVGLPDRLRPLRHFLTGAR